MSWRYVAAVDENGQWSVRELYQSSDLAWSSTPEAAHGETREELERDLGMMLADVVRHDLYLDLVTETVVDD